MPPARSPHDEYLDPYRQAVARHGAGFEATLWSSPEAQRIRFDVMIEMVEFRDAVILDAGCGAGDFAQHLLARKVPFARFIGIDGIPAQIERAIAAGLPRCEFHEGDFVHDRDLFARAGADVIAFSGTLNTMGESLAREVIEAAYAAARRGVVFNFLSDRAPRRILKRDLWPARRFDTIGMVDWALRLSPLVEFRQEYLEGHDATVSIVKAIGS